ncbi:MAG: hypothetical protein GF416_05620 [Candidatus Altiarchaeales archaeon]|nr:hypothetical protein [Candidatus Altiarchaeales archaeon]MBD3416593.1 hypothetical protein [Candidatus Altiarchaeales archaeon]
MKKQTRRFKLKIYKPPEDDRTPTVEQTPLPLEEPLTAFMTQRNMASHLREYLTYNGQRDNPRPVEEVMARYAIHLLTTTLSKRPRDELLDALAEREGTKLNTNDQIEELMKKKLDEPHPIGDLGSLSNEDVVRKTSFQSSVIIYKLLTALPHADEVLGHEKLRTMDLPTPPQKLIGR